MVKTFVPLHQAAAINGVVIRELVHTSSKSYAVLEKKDGSVTMCESIVVNGGELAVDTVVIRDDLVSADMGGQRLRFYSQK